MIRQSHYGALGRLPAGSIGRSHHAREPGMCECGCGYALNQHYWGQGYMPEALQAAFTYTFTVLGHSAPMRNVIEGTPLL